MDKGLDNTENFYADEAELYAAANDTLPPSLLAFADRACEHLSSKPRFMLDFGCGHGRDLKLFKEYGFNCTGIDRSRPLLEIAHQNIPGSIFPDGKVEDKDYTLLIEGDLRTLPSPLLLSTFDLIWSCASLLHLNKEDAFTALKVANQMAREDCVLALSLKMGDTETKEPDSLGTGKSLFVAKYEAVELGNLIGRAGFKYIEHNITQRSNGECWIEMIGKKIPEKS